MTDADDLSPLMRQYRDIKQAYREAILFFRVGDFYEMFFQDAEEASHLLSIALTSRDKGRPDPIPLCGVPYHAATGYIAKLLKAGRTVALCEQVEDPKLAKGLVRREVVRLYTPGTLTDTELLPSHEATYLAAIVPGPSNGTGDADRLWGLAVLEPSTGEFWVQEFTAADAFQTLRDELGRLDPKEVLCAGTGPDGVTSADRLRPFKFCVREAGWFDRARSERLLCELFSVASLEGFGCRGLSAAIQAAGAVVQYLRDTRPNAGLGHVQRLSVKTSDTEMHLDAATIRNLELLRPLVDDAAGRDGTTLLSVLDRTVSVMGSRLLREWLVRPLLDVDAIRDRLDAVDELFGNLKMRSDLRTELRRISDMSRLGSRLSLGTANPRELLALRQSIAALPGLRLKLSSARAAMLQQIVRSWDDLPEVQDLLDRAVAADAPLSIRDGGVIRDGYDAKLDELRTSSREGKGWIVALEARERERTGIDSLKVRYNQVFGYYIEVTKANLAKVPSDYLRKQTLANAERFTTVELQDLEQRVTGAGIRLASLERELFEALQMRLAAHVHRIQAMASTVALLDVLSALAEAAALYRYVRPEIDRGGMLRISQGRHPVVERLGVPGGFVANDALLDLDGNRLLILTGPNMAGKSTYLRQVALIVLMAQIGSFVPAASAHIGLVDRVFTRVGASDNLAAGQSTFMVEMTESAQILNCATSRSLILLDEVGRGTSTYDGLSIAWAVAEHIHDRGRLGARTLFATHYHEMTELARQREGVKNYTVAVTERHGEVLFLRKIIEGGADRSYGIHVAQLAGLPRAVIERAQEVLAQLEQSSDQSSLVPSLSTQHDSTGLVAGSVLSPQSSALLRETPPSPPAHPIIEEVRQMDLFSMTPLEALNRLAELQRRIDQDS